MLAAYVKRISLSVAISNRMEPTPINLKQYGIDLGLLLSGLFGAILLTSKGSAMNLTRTVSSLLGGAASANYITPLVVNVAKLNGEHFNYGIAFILGFLGLKGIEYFSGKFLPENLHEDIVYSPQRRSRTRHTPKRIKQNRN